MLMRKPRCPLPKKQDPAIEGVPVHTLVPDHAIFGVHAASCWCLFSGCPPSLHWHESVPLAPTSLTCRGRLHPYSHRVTAAHHLSPQVHTALYTSTE